LSERPTPPSLDAALRSLYPDEARRRAISGSASLRVRIGSDGRVREASVLSETFAGFGTACQKAVLGSHWSPPRDRDGRAVQTEVRYTCRFVVD
jgi:protein TonB